MSTRDAAAGELITHVETLQLQDGERWLYAYAVEPGSRSAEAIRLLGTWAATQDAEEADQAKIPRYTPHTT